MAGRRRRGFSLIELLVVIIIIALVVAILVPTLGMVRDAARGTSTQSLMSTVQGATRQFENDHRRLPGYFATAGLCANTNDYTEGFTAGEDAMLDLAGGVVGFVSPSGPTQIRVGPTPSPDSKVTVDLKTIGVGEVYFAPPEKFYMVQPPGGQITVQIGGAGGSEDQLPDLVDAWGSPLLFWSASMVVGPIVPDRGHYLCARNCVDGNDMDESARFYWATNAGFLKATALGRKGVSQPYVAGEACSLIGAGAPGVTAEGVPSLEAWLGSPNGPYRPLGAVLSQHGSQYNAAIGRSNLIIHSAGPNGYYVGSQERGGRVIRAAAGRTRGFCSTAGRTRTWLRFLPPRIRTTRAGRPAWTSPRTLTTCFPRA